MNMWENYYYLEGREVRQCKSFADMARGSEFAGRQVGRKDYPNGASVSTVFLSFNHTYAPGQLRVFETMIRGMGDDDEERMVRYATYDEAEQGHNEAVAYADALFAENEVEAEIAKLMPLVLAKQAAAEAAVFNKTRRVRVGRVYEPPVDFPRKAARVGRRQQK